MKILNNVVPYGSGGGGGDGGSEQPTSAQCNTIATLYEFLCEGEIEGPAIDDSLYKSTYFNDIAVQNSEGVFNFNGVTISGVYGTYDQTGFEDVGEQTSVTIYNTEVQYGSPITYAVTDTNVNDIIVTIMWPSLYYTSSQGDVNPRKVSFSILVQPDGGEWVLVGSYDVCEKFNAAYMRDYRITQMLVNYGPGPWNIQVRRDTEDLESVKVVDKFYFYSITEVIREKFTYPNSVILKYTFDAQEFGTSAPSRTTKIKGLKVKYPSNYNPTTRTFSGSWDGNMNGYGYTNNPAWFIYAVLTNEEWGMGLDSKYVDKASLYQIAAYCDGMVDVTSRSYLNGYETTTSTEPRFLLNVNIEQRKEALQVLKDVCGACRCYPLWYGSYVTFIQDRPYTGNVMVASPSNVLDGSFVYSNTAMDVQHNTIEVTYNNDDDFGRTITVSFSDDDAVNLYGVVKKSVTLFGCNRKSEALRAAKYILYTDLYETRVVQFTGGIEWIASKPGDVIAVQDAFFAGADYSGRVVSSNTTFIEVDRYVTLEAGKTYTLKCQSKTGDVFERELTNLSGSYNLLIWADPVTDMAPVDGVWVLEVNDLSLQYFRILSITPGSGEDSFQYTITGVTYDENKFTAVEGDFFYEEPQIAVNDGGNIAPPTNFNVKPYTYTEGDNGNTKYGLLLSWEHSQDVRRSYYELQYSYNSSSYKVLDKPTESSYSLLNAYSGEYNFRVRACGGFATSVWLEYINYQMGTTTSGLQPPTNLHVKNGNTTWSGTDCEVVWTLSSGVYYDGVGVGYANVKGYSVNVHKADGTFLRSTFVDKNTNEFSYTYEMNNSDNSGNPQRSLRFDVYTVDVYNELSDECATGTFTNPAPDMSTKTPDIQAGPTYLIVDWNAPVDNDMSHYVLYCGVNNPPIDSGGVVVNYPSKSATVFGLTYGTTYYAIVYPYDYFGVGIPSQVDSGSPTLIPAENVDIELKGSVTYTDSINSTTDNLLSLYDSVWNSGGIAYPGSWSWIQTAFGIENYINGVQLWASSSASVCVSISQTSDGSDWLWFGGNTSHELVLSDGVYRLTEYTNEADAKTNYWTTVTNFDYAFLPNNITAMRCRLHINTSTTIHELVFRRIVIAEDMAVESLSAISANIGNITAGIIQSEDYTANTGFMINLTTPEILFGGALGQSLSWDSVNGLMVNGQISFSSGTTGYTNIGDAPTTLSGLDPAASAALVAAANNASQAIQDAADAQETADGKITSFYQSRAPLSGYDVGDFWIDTDDGNKLYRRSTISWVPVQDSAIQTALNNAQTAQTTADGKAVIFYSASTPSGAATGDLWYDTDDTQKRLYRYSGSAWQVVSSYGATWGTDISNQPTSLSELNATEYNTLITSAANAAKAIQDAATAQETADGKITSFYQTSAPLSGYDVGDFWIDTDGGNKLYRRSSSAWVPVQDSAIQTALNNAQTAQTTADGKAVIFYSASTPSGAATGDLWYDTDDTQKRLYRYSGSAWQVVSSYGAAWGTNITNQPTSLNNINSGEYSRLPTSVVGALAYLNTVGNDQITTIQGGKIQTGVIYGNNSYSYWDLTNNKMYFTASATLQFASTAVIKFGDYAGLDGFGTEYIGFHNGQLFLTSNDTGVGSYSVLELYSTAAELASYGGADIYITSSDDIFITSADDTHINAGTGNKIYIKFNSVYKIQCNEYGFKPYANDLMLLGDTGYRWSGVYGSAFYDEGGLFQDLQDDLLVMSEIKPKKHINIDPESGEKQTSTDTLKETTTGLEQIDLHSLPRWMTNYDDVAKKLREDSGDLLSDDDIDELILDDNEAGWMLSRNISRFNDLTSGAVRQLDSEMIAMFELMSSRITDLENKVKNLEKLLEK